MATNPLFEICFSKYHQHFDAFIGSSLQTTPPPRSPPPHQPKGGQNYRGLQKIYKKHTTVGIRWWSPTQLLVYRSEACVWQSGRDAQFSSVCGRMCLDRRYPPLRW